MGPGFEPLRVYEVRRFVVRQGGGLFCIQAIAFTILYTHFFTPKNPSTQHYSRYPIKYQTNKSDELKTQTRHNLAFVLGWGQDSNLKIFSSQEKVFTFCLIFFTICAEKVCYKVCNACYKVSNTCYKVCNTCYKLCNKNFLIG